MKGLCARLAMMMIICTASPAESSIEILIPPEHSSTHSDQLFVIGTASASVVELRLNGVPVDTVETKNTIFHGLIKFGFGLNEIEVISSGDDISDTGQVSSSVEILCEPYDIKKYRRLYEPYIFHGDAPRTECSPCHQAVDETPAVAGKIAACLNCHSNVKVEFTGHTNFNNSNCISCHQVDPDLSSTLPERGHTNEPCFSCHSDKIGKFAQDYVHGPVAGGSCRVCHDPHGSEYEKNLQQPVQILCFSCHREVEKELTQPIVHKPFEEAQCIKCHDPHSTNNRWILQRDSEKLCLNCHKGDYDLEWHRHPFNVKPRKPLNAPLKLTEKGRLECLSCHNPHATESVHLLRTEQKFTCKGCHSNLL